MVFEDSLINGDIYIYPPVDPRCHGNENWYTIGYNSAGVIDFCAYWEFLGMGHRMLPIAFFPD